MELNMETLIAVLIVGVALGFAGRGLYRTLSGKDGCGCGGSCSGAANCGSEDGSEADERA
jgi:hypothetical protein